MSERDILIRALRASGSEREAQLAEAILPAAAEPAVADPTPPAAAALPAADATRPEAEEQPSGLTREQLDGMSREEVLERMDEVDEAMRRGV
jgi:hypothetical protein